VADIEIGPISRHIGGNDDLISVRSHVTDEGRPTAPAAMTKTPSSSTVPTVSD